MKPNYLLSAVILITLVFTSGCTTSADTPPNKVIGDLKFQTAPALADSITLGGKGGKIIKVTNLQPSGKGSLKEALEQSFPRTIVFDVSGVIDLQGKSLKINDPFVTIDGASSPSPGITIIGGGIRLQSHDIRIEHLKIRPGDLGEAPNSGRSIDAIATYPAYNLVIDHCSLSWGTDENISASGKRFSGETPKEWQENTSHNIMFSNNIISEGLLNSTHSKGSHSRGMLIHDNVRDVYIFRNLFTSNNKRNPVFKGGTKGSVINNFVYNPGYWGVHYALKAKEWADNEYIMGEIDLIGNVMKYGPSTRQELSLFSLGGEGDLSIYENDNLIDTSSAPPPLLSKYKDKTIADFRYSKSNHQPLDGLKIVKSKDLFLSLQKNVGARPWDRDLIDIRILKEASSRTGSIIDSQTEVGGYP
ncbi:hypothetical protein [Hirschia maritima]|uniref:hypothetical protein n=1 Tax=Hirschia maritima TaxID=1121961 RepID=UPI00036306E7|nr:hypothetical protein [Hirschia maritima]